MVGDCGGGLWWGTVVGDGGGSTPNFSVIPWLTFLFGLLPDMVISHDI